MVKRTLLIILSVLILTQLVLAMPTEIRVKTLPYNEVIVTITKNGQTLERYTGSSNYFGDAIFKYSSSSRTFDMYVQVRNLKETLYFESYPETEAGGTQLVELYPADFIFPEPINRENKTQQTPMTGDVVASSNTTEINETTAVVPPAEVDQPVVTETPVVVTNSTPKKSWFTSFASDENGEVKISLNTLYYIIGAIIVIIIVIFLIRRIVKKRRDNPYYDYKPAKSEVKVRKLSELMEDRGDLNVPSRDFAKAEKKLHDAEAQVSRLKNQDRIDSIQKKIEEQQRELRRLQRG
ncbi:Uncharacterised protein [uncultured archaeon]|nr:Uncharacterised protein [uncultured archaeon]